MRSNGHVIGFLHHSETVSDTSVLDTFIARPVTMPKLFSAKNAASHVLSMFLMKRSRKSELAFTDV